MTLQFAVVTGQPRLSVTSSAGRTAEGWRPQSFHWGCHINRFTGADWSLPKKVSEREAAAREVLPAHTLRYYRSRQGRFPAGFMSLNVQLAHLKNGNRTEQKILEDIDPYAAITIFVCAVGTSLAVYRTQARNQGRK
jgi:hypothetical protein